MRFFLMFIFCFLIAGVHFSSAQCTADPNVTDPEGNGEMFPLELVFKVGVASNITVTILPPPSAAYNGNNIPLSKIVLRGLGNKPSWMSYVSNANQVTTGTQNPVQGYELVVGNRYCMLVTGTPDGSFIGVDSMAVMVDAYVNIGGSQILMAENTNGGYIKYTVCAANDNNCHPTSVFDRDYYQFETLPSNPSIFTYSALLGFFTERSVKTSLLVSDVLGNVIYSENVYSQPGDNFFQFDGKKLSTGTYIYTISDGKNIISKRIIKAN